MRGLDGMAEIPHVRDLLLRPSPIEVAEGSLKAAPGLADCL